MTVPTSSVSKPVKKSVGVQKKRGATLKDDDIQIINSTRKSQTSPDLNSVLLTDYKWSYMELLEVHEELKDKYEELKISRDDQKHRSETLPVMYRDQFYHLLTEHRNITKKYNDMKQQLRDIID